MLNFQSRSFQNTIGVIYYLHILLRVHLFCLKIVQICMTFFFQKNYFLFFFLYFSITHDFWNINNYYSRCETFRSNTIRQC